MSDFSFRIFMDDSVLTSAAKLVSHPARIYRVSAEIFEAHRTQITVTYILIVLPLAFWWIKRMIAQDELNTRLRNRVSYSQDTVSYQNDSLSNFPLPDPGTADRLRELARQEDVRLRNAVRERQEAEAKEKARLELERRKSRSADEATKSALGEF